MGSGRTGRKQVKPRRIVLTGGGSAGHVTANLALLPRLLAKRWEILYIGSVDGIEAQLLKGVAGVRYAGIATGKLRRYVDWRNLTDPFNVLRGVGQAYGVIRRFRPDVVFSKGGFVSVPVVIGGRLNGVPVIIHESDLTPGLANRIALRFATRMLTTFEQTAQGMADAKVESVGAVVRPEVLQGDPRRGRTFCGFAGAKPVLLVMGGSLGSRRINEAVRTGLDRLLRTFDVVHLCGKGNLDPAADRKGYRQFEYLQAELPDVLAAADLVVSRAGSNSIFEFLSLRKPMLLIPLSRQASRGDQIHNAEAFAKSGYAAVLAEEALTPESLLQSLERLYAERGAYRQRMESYSAAGALQRVLDVIEATAGGPGGA
ncbi:MAG TPA: undecaprenyldiphospho-muramoylpentapeptide beta-N-acetylglucosaminyltransferase [Limnochordia bacterium]|nr:undecaprenyldiphospho-muramoylpentapeptide beta-N-acetylglucosaminyltransferase [Limnochordia bacterium]